MSQSVSTQSVFITLYSHVMLLIGCLHSVRLQICYLRTDFYKPPSTRSLAPFLLLMLITFGVHLTGAGKDTVLLGNLMVNDLFNVDGAETTVVFGKPLR